MSRIVLVACDEVADEIGTCLDQAGHEVLRCRVRSRTLGEVRDVVPDLVLLEAGEDSEDAELLKQLAKDDSTRYVPVLRLLQKGEAVASSLGMGAVDVLHTNDSHEERLARVEAALRAKATVDELLAEHQRSVLLQLAGAVAHKLNQPLTSLSVSAEMLQGELEKVGSDPALIRRRSSEILKGVERMSEIIKRLEQIVQYRSVPYVGDLRIVDLDAVDGEDGEDGEDGDAAAHAGDEESE